MRPLRRTELGMAGWVSSPSAGKQLMNDLPLWSRRMGCVWECQAAVPALHLGAQSGEDSCRLLLTSSL